MARAKSLFHSDYHAINWCARALAKTAVKEMLRGQGVRLTLVKPAEISRQAEQYLKEHPELYQAAVQRARQMGLIGILPIMATPDDWAERPAKSASLSD
jgi:hypothetical protein